MKKLEDLKKELLQDKINSFYVFYGEDFGIRKHYINKISTYFKQIKYYNSCEDITNLTMAKSLFKIKQLLVVYNDQQFCRQNELFINTFIKRLGDTYTCILVYEQPVDNSTLFKKFSDYITYFPIVQDNIAKEFVEDEINLSNNSIEDLAYNCENNYNNILLETDKIKNYAESKQLSTENAYESLFNKQQLLNKKEDFSCNFFMNDILMGNFSNVAYWTSIIKEKPDKFYITLTSIFNDYLIAYLIKKYGKWDGSSRAYNYGLSWSRAKIIRDFTIPYTSEYLLNVALKITELDVEVKTGRLNKDDIIDKFISLIM